MVNYEMSELLNFQDGDVPLYATGNKLYGKRVMQCQNGHQPTFSMGFEATLMTFGMTQHNIPQDVVLVKPGAILGINFTGYFENPNWSRNFALKYISTGAKGKMGETVHS